MDEILIGEITSTSGLKGEVRVFPHTDFPERFSHLTEIGVRRRSEPTRMARIEYARITGSRVVLKLAGVETIEDAEALRGAHLMIPREQMMPLREDEYYHDQLLGLEVVTTTGESLGKITHILQTGANDVYETPLAMIPAVKEFIREVDLEHGRMLVEDRPGLKTREAEE